MKFYRKHRRLAIVVAALATAATLIVVVTAPTSSAGVTAQVVLTAAALLALTLAYLRRRPRPAEDCGALIVCGAAFAVAFSVTSGVPAVLFAAGVIAVIAAATTLLFLSAEAAAHETRSRLRR